MLAILPVFLSIRPALLRDHADRPQLSESAVSVERGRFRIHFDREGPDAPEPIDRDGNGLPDLIDEVAAGLVEGEKEFLYEGWRPLVGDNGEGGSTTLDVYIHAIDAFGYATPIPAPSGGWTCYLQIDQDVQLTGRVARSVAKHELHHCVEYRYTIDTAGWLYEAAATYEQYSHEKDPVLDYALGFLWSERLATPEWRLGATAGRFEYAAFLWMKYWSEVDGFDPGRLPRLWEALERTPAWQEGLNQEALEVFGRDLPSVYLDHAIWNSFACGNDDQEHYLEDPLPCIVTSTVPITPWDGRSVEIVHDDAPFTSTYLSLPGSGEDIAVSCTATGAGADGLRLALVSVDEQGRSWAEAIGEEQDPGVASAQVSSVVGGEVRVIIAGTGEEPLQALCTQVTPGRLSKDLGLTGCATAGAPGQGLWLVGMGLLVRRRMVQSNGQASRNPTVSSSGTGSTYLSAHRANWATPR